MSRNSRRVFWLFVLFALCSGAVSTCAARQATSTDSGKIDSARIASARRIIAELQQYELQARLLIAQAQVETKDAKTLEGAARKYQSNVVPVMQPLRGAKLAQAKHMFQGDLQEFSRHAKEYQEHTDQVRRMFGQCAASRKAYEANKDAFTLHCDEFHMPNVVAPHICLEMGQSMEEADHLSHQIKANIQRLLQAEMQLRQTEKRLSNAVENSALVDAQVRKQNEMNLHEQDLAAEFGRLQEEYKQLDVERRALKASGVKTPVATVHARVR